MRNLKKTPIPDFERRLIADADDVDAWDAPVRVEPAKSPRPEWYRRRSTPIGMALANCGGQVDARRIYDFIANNVTGASVYESRPKGIAAAGLDFYLVLDVVASVTSIANVLWMAYDRFIAPRRRTDDSAGIVIYLRGGDGDISRVWLGCDVTTEADFLERFEELVSRAKDPKLRADHEATLRKLEDSDSWIEIKGETRPS